jgi:hypothetical protein
MKWVAIGTHSLMKWWHKLKGPFIKLYLTWLFVIYTVTVIEKWFSTHDFWWSDQFMSILDEVYFFKLLSFLNMMLQPPIMICEGFVNDLILHERVEMRICCFCYKLHFLVWPLFYGRVCKAEKRNRQT